MDQFTSLHLMTEYSFMKSAIKIDELILFAKKHTLNALAITDHNNMFGVSEFINKCQKNNIKPIIGIDLDVADFRLILLAKNFQGYQHLCQLVSKKAQGNDIKIDDIDDQHIFIIDHPIYGYYLKKHKKLSFNNYFIATNDDIKEAVHVIYTRVLEKNDLKTIELIDQIKDSKSEVVNIFPLDVNKNSLAVKRVTDIIKNCHVVFPNIENLLPRFKNQDNISSVAFLKKLLDNKVKHVLANIDNKIAYLKRIKYEVAIVEKLGFADYFLIIQDLVSWAKGHKIIIGPGRGSAAGSIIAYILGITEVDPIKYNLLFERFLNPERISMPDIDIDIQDNRRDEVVSYLFKKYGQENVALISTFQRLGAKSSLRDVARMLNISNIEVTNLTKTIPLNFSLMKAYENSSKFRAMINSSEKFTKLFNLAKKIEGLPRQYGTHAAGVIVSHTPIIKQMALVKSADGFLQVQSSMDYLEENGLLKIDLLGLRNLTILQRIQHEIFLNYHKKVDLAKISLDDSQTNQLLSTGQVNGIFQLESFGMKKTLKEVGVDSLYDLAAIISLYRPGPMEYIKTYAKRKQKKEVIPKITKKYDQALQETYGIIVYQEQIMQIAQDFSGMSFGQADILRRAIGKKDFTLLKSLKNNFINGSVANGASESLALKIYKMIEKFADYGFNKSHAIAYGILSYRMAFLKARFPFEFYTSLIAHSVGSLVSLKMYIMEAKEKKITIVAPNINISRAKVFNQNKKIILPLSIIKGLGFSASEKIINERAKGKFTDFFNLVARLRFVGVSKSLIMFLIKGNVLRDYGNMQSLINALPQAFRYGEMITVSSDSTKILNFKMLPTPKMIISQRRHEDEIKFEKEIYGFNLTVFPTDKYEKTVKIIDIVEKKPTVVVAQVINIKKIKDKNNREMGIIKLSDSSATIEAFAFKGVFEFIKKTPKHRIVEVKLLLKNKDNFRHWSIEGQWKEL